MAFLDKACIPPLPPGGSAVTQVAAGQSGLPPGAERRLPRTVPIRTLHTETVALLDQAVRPNEPVRSGQHAVLGPFLPPESGDLTS
jgi:hypothetical protein